MFISLLLTSAMADTPSAVAEMVVDANALVVGSNPVDAVGAPTRLTAAAITSRMQTILDRLAASGCTDGVVQGFGAGSVVGGTATGTSDLDGTINLTYGAGGVSGTFDGLVVGGNVGKYRKGHFVADVDDSGSFFAGVHIRVRGSTRVFFGTHGTCDLGGFAEPALSRWFAGDLTGLDNTPDSSSTLFPAEEPVDRVGLRTTYEAGDVTLAKRVFGDTVVLLDDTSRPIVEDEVLAVCPGFAQFVECGAVVSIFDVTTPAVVLGENVTAGCADWSSDVTLVLNGGEWTTGGFGFFGAEPALHASDSTTLELDHLPAVTTTHPTVDFDGLFDACPVI